ncbi:hypothetical protein ACFY2T_09740 [Streptomyces sp. NPDC001260]|uniref:hypothetical protein n=1 Tax=Streptomyces sp. NPDC001260 TaxID=3364551 RepID=UPI0036783CC4
MRLARRTALGAALMAALAGTAVAPAAAHSAHRHPYPSTATNLVPDDTNGVADVFVRKVG